jgi:hypothetical protein
MLNKYGPRSFCGFPPNKNPKSNHFFWRAQYISVIHMVSRLTWCGYPVPGGNWVAKTFRYAGAVEYRAHSGSVSMLATSLLGLAVLLCWRYLMLNGERSVGAKCCNNCYKDTVQCLQLPTVAYSYLP